LFTAWGEADFLSGFAFASTAVFVSEPLAAVLIRVAPLNLPANGIADHLVGRAMVGQFGDCQTLLVRASSHPRTTADTLGFNEGFVHRNGDMHELERVHELSILPLQIQSCSIPDTAIVITICLER
jgi:hypothetical protein